MPEECLYFKSSLMGCRAQEQPRGASTTSDSPGLPPVRSLTPHLEWLLDSVVLRLSWRPVSQLSLSSLFRTNSRQKPPGEGAPGFCPGPHPASLIGPSSEQLCFISPHNASPAPTPGQAMLFLPGGEKGRP